MRQNRNNKTNGAIRLFNAIAFEKKKTIFALGLVVLMVVMWLRVFAKKGPQAAQATAQTQQNTAQQTAKPIKVTFVDLHKVQGRNDTVKRDFFASNNWRTFKTGSEDNNSKRVQEVEISSASGEDVLANRIAQKLKLHAVVMGVYPGAFINDTFVAEKDKIRIADGVELYQCEVISINENEVVIQSGNAKIMLRLTQTTETDK